MNQSKFSVTSAVIVLIPVQYVYEDFPLPSLQPLPPNHSVHPPALPLYWFDVFPPFPRSPFIPLSTSSYNCLPPSSSTPQINNTVENVHPPLLHPLSSPWTHPIPPTSTHTSLSPFLYQLPSSCWISLHHHPPSQSVHLGAPSPRSSARLATHLTSLSSCWGWWSPSLAPQPFHFTNIWRLPAHIQKMGAIRDWTERKSHHVKAAICLCIWTVQLPRWLSGTYPISRCTSTYRLGKQYRLHISCHTCNMRKVFVIPSFIVLQRVLLGGLTQIHTIP